MAAPTPERFRQVAGRFATGVTVLGTAGEGTLHALTVNAFCSVSLEPPLVQVCIDREALMHDLLARTRVFGVTMLAADQGALSAHFASSSRPQGPEQFDGVEWRGAPVTGSPILGGGLAWMDCRVTAVYPAGDHSLFLGQVLDLGLGDGSGAGAGPLLFFASRYHELGPERGPAPWDAEP